MNNITMMKITLTRRDPTNSITSHDGSHEMKARQVACRPQVISGDKV